MDPLHTTDEIDNVEPTPDSPPAQEAPNQLGQVVYEGMNRALREVMSTPTKAQDTATKFVEPANEAIAAMDLRDELYDEIQDIVRDAPAEVREEVRKSMRQFQSYNSLQLVKSNGIHKTIAYAALGQAAKEGKYSPAGAKNAANNLSREPVHSEPQSRIPSDFRREQEDVCRILGVTLTEAELQAAWRNR